MTLNEFFRQLGRRSVFHVAGVYAVVCWLLVQVTAVAEPALGLPEWTTRLAIALTFIGAPIVMVAAWFVSGAARHGAPAPRTVRWGYVIAAVFAVAAAGVAGYLMQIRSAGTVSDTAVGAPLSSIAVLPFINLGAEAEDQYFSDGVTEDILTQLTKIDGLRVISRTSATRYRGGSSIREIGRELDVATVLEGAVRRSGGRVRVTAQLVDANRDQQLWAETYDRDLADIFAIQSEIAHSIARALSLGLESPGGVPR
ncbi:hypothetical protein BH23GEM9_BH23GEM9_32280 [soil metagenome]